MEQPRFRNRSFTALLMLVSFAVLIVSGLVLYFGPSGRIADTMGWNLLSLDRRQWADLHACFALLMVVAALPHVWMNRRPLLNHLRGSASAAMQPLARLRIEAFTAVVVGAAVLMATIWQVPPISYVSQVRAVMRGSQSTEPGPRHIGPGRGWREPGSHLRSAR